MIERLDHLVMTVADIARTVDCFQGADHETGRIVR
jgi:hypothetical protein